MKPLFIFMIFIFGFLLRPENADAQTAENGFVLRTILEGTEFGNHDGIAVEGPVDFDNDGWNEFVVLCTVPDAEVKLFEATEDNIYTQRSAYDITGSVYWFVGDRALAIGNVDGDPEPEIVVGYSSNVGQGAIIVLDVNPSTMEITKRSNAPSPLFYPTSIGIVGDTDNDNDPEFVVGYNVPYVPFTVPQLQLFEWDGMDWTIIDETQVVGGGWGISDIKIGNVDDDPENEIIFMGNGGTNDPVPALGIVKVVSGQFQSDGQILNNPSTERDGYNLATIGDIDGNGKNEIVIGVQPTSANGTERIYIFEHTQGGIYDTDEPNGIIELNNYLLALAVGDFDYDGKGEIYLSYANPNNNPVDLRYWEHNGVEGDFSAASFDDPVTIFDGIGYADVIAFKYFDGIDDLLDNDAFPDIVLVTDPLGSSIPEAYVVESIYDNPLPVSLTSFTVSAGNNRVTLRWVTASEQENLGFKVMRSNEENGNYVQLSSYEGNPNLQGRFNSNAQTKYQFTDENVVNDVTYWYKIIDVNMNGIHTGHGPLSATPHAVGNDITTINVIPAGSFNLHPNYPNPFNPETTFRFDIPALSTGNSEVEVTIFNAQGQKVKTLFRGVLTPGTHEVSWKGLSDSGVLVSSGPYFAVLRMENLVRTSKMLLIK